MIHRFADAVANWLVRSGAVSEQDKDLYSYAVFNVVFSSVPLWIAMSAGLLMDMLSKSILFILPFVMIRKFSGGFHLKSQNKCFIISTLIILAFLKAIDIVLEEEAYIITLALAILSAILIFVGSPVDSAERRLNEREKLVFSRIAKILVTAFISLILILFYIERHSIAVPISYGIVLPAVLQLPCLVMRNSSNATD